MDELWKALSSIHVITNPDASRRKTDKKYAKDLQISQAEDRWRSFYQAVDALERGCGFQQFPELEMLCQKALAQDEHKFLQILADKPAMMDIVVILRYVKKEVMLRWVEQGNITNVNVLFECLRKVLQRPLSEQEQEIVAKGLLHLCALSLERFQYILRSKVLFRDDYIGAVRAMLPYLTEEGWSRLSACVIFEQLDRKHFHFWNECARDQNWQAIGARAKPLLQAWYRALEQAAAKGSVWNSLYNEVSNLLIAILIHEIETPSSCESEMKRVIIRTETAMFHWYERSLQQSSALLAGLSQLEHLRFVWLNLSRDTVPSDTLCGQAIRLITQWRHLWISSSNEEVQKEIEGLTTWLCG